MASAPSKAFLLVQLLLLLGCFQGASSSYSHPPVYPPTQHHHDDHHHHHAPGLPPVYSPVHPPSRHHHGHPPSPAPSVTPFHPPAHPPVKPPAHPPVKPPGHPPVKPPVNPPVNPPVSPPVINPFLRKFIAVQGVVYCKACKASFDGAKPIFGAQVKLLCKNTRYTTVATAKTDKNGYFFLQAPKTVTSFASHKCKVYLDSSPISSCRQPSHLNGGVTGAPLRLEIWSSIRLPFILYSVGPLAFEPKCKAPGPK